MKILIADVLLKGKPHSDWKEGYEFCYAFRKLGHECDVYGPNGDLSETEIPNVYKNYDFALITENYWSYSHWKWWDWKSIDIPKVFWAIDTHIVNYQSFIRDAKITHVAFNNKQDYDKYNLENSFWLPLGVSTTHFDVNYNLEKTRDISFIGGLTSDRKIICDKFDIECLNAYGNDYVKEMQKSKICFNQSISYDINGKYFDIIGSGSFMLTNYNEYFFEFVGRNEYIGKMFYHNENDLGDKIKYYLSNDDEREYIARNAREFIFKNHSYENRANIILNKINEYLGK